MTALETAAQSTAYANDRAHVFHSWSAQHLINPLPLAGGEGCEFWAVSYTHLTLPTKA